MVQLRDHPTPHRESGTTRSSCSGHCPPAGVSNLAVPGLAAGVDGHPARVITSLLAKPFEWFGEDSALAQAHIARPQALGFAKLVLDIDAGGAVSGCRATDTMELPVDVAAGCSDLASQKFLPALDPEGKRIAGGYIVTFSPRRFDAAHVSQAHPLFTGERDPTPVPTMAPELELGLGWLLG